MSAQELRRNRLGTTDVSVSELGFGAAVIGNLYRAVGDDAALEALDAAWDSGVRYFDTAPHYGLGLSERRLGSWLTTRPRDQYVISTKVGRRLVPVTGKAVDQDPHFAVPATHVREWDFSRDGVRRSLDSSLSRLGLDRVDIVLLHDPDDHWLPALEQAIPALAELRDQGVVGAIGAGMNQSEMLARFVRESDIDVVMVAGRYTLLEQGALTDLLPAAVERDVAVLAAGVFNSGLLARARPPADAKYDYGSAPVELIERAARIAMVCERHGIDLPTAAARFPLTHPAVASVVLGVRTAEQMQRNADIFAAEVPDGLWEELVQDGLLDPSVLGVAGG